MEKQQSNRATRFLAFACIIAAVACGEAEAGTGRVEALTEDESTLGSPAGPVAGEGESDLLLLDLARPEDLTDRSLRDCGEELSAHERARCRMALADELTRAAIAADQELLARSSSSRESMTNEIEARYGRARRALVDDPATDLELDELHDTWRDELVGPEPTADDEALDAEARAADVSVRGGIEVTP